MRRYSLWFRAVACSVLAVASGAFASVVAAHPAAAAAVTHDSEVYAFGSATNSGWASASHRSIPRVSSLVSVHTL